LAAIRNRTRVVACLGAVAAGSAAAPAAAAPPKIRDALESARAPAGQLERTDAVSLPGGASVYRFGQEVAGVPVLDADAVVSDAPGAPPVLVADVTSPAVEAPPSPRVAVARAIAIASRHTEVRRLRARPSARLWIRSGARGTLVWRVSIPAARPLGDFEILVDAGSGEVVRTRNLLRDFRRGRAKLYDPNPVVENGGFRRLKHDHHDHDTRPLRSLRLRVTLPKLKEGQRCLRGKWAHVKLGRSAHEVCRRGLRWRRVTRSRNRFEALMAYYHMTLAQRYIHRLGFSRANDNDIDDRSQAAIADACSNGRCNVDNSFYSQFTRKIKYGSGGVDDAEDADVILHEYGHAMQDEQAPGFLASFGVDPGSLQEGSADYWAAVMSSLSAGTTNEDDVCLFDWDATSYHEFAPANTFGDRYCGRRADYPKTLAQAKDDPDCQYPLGPQGLDVHCVGQVWSSGLWDLREQWGIDGETMDRVYLSSQFMYVAGEHFKNAVKALLDADEVLTGGANEAAICGEMEGERGIAVPSCP
jgi:hypothetical protein